MIDKEERRKRVVDGFKNIAEHTEKDVSDAHVFAQNIQDEVLDQLEEAGYSPERKIKISNNAENLDTKSEKTNSKHPTVFAIKLKCEHEGCLEDGYVECHIPNHPVFGDKGIDVIKVIAEMDKVEHLCQDHAYEAGYCTLCGEFWGGIESFDFNNPQQLCENCLEQMKDETGENDEKY